MENIVQLARNEYTYNAETGEFIKVNARVAVTTTGLTGLRLGGKKVARNKLAWMIHYGEVPAHPLKYTNGDKLDCRVENLELMNKKPRETKQAQDRLETKIVVDEMAAVTDAGYDELVYKVVNIAGPNKQKLIDIGYELPVGVNYKWLVKIDDLIEIGSNELVTVVCSDCGKTRETKAYRGKGKCKSCSKTGVKHTLEHRRNNSRAKRDESLSEEDRVDRRSIPWVKSWAKDVKVRAHFTCECCGQVGGKLASHHKDSYRSNKERRTDILNGVCLCDACHKDFHKKYGQGNNTVDQFEDWILDKLDEREVA